MPGQFITFEGMKFLAQNALTQQGLTSFDGVATVGSASISGISSYAGLAEGQLIASSVLPPGTYIVDLDNESGVITLSQPAASTTPSSSQSQFVAGGNYTQNLPLTIHLLQGAIPLQDNMLFSQLTEANYDGYSPQEAIGPVLINSPFPRDYAAFQYQRQTWEPTDYAVQNLIVGHCWTYTAPGSSTPIVVAAEVYAAPVPLQQDGDILTFNPTLSIAFDQTAGVASPGIP